MYYEVNVSRYKRHVFATHERSVTTEWELKEILKLFSEKFPESEGFNIMVTQYWKAGETIDVDKYLKEV